MCNLCEVAAALDLHVADEMLFDTMPKEHQVAATKVVLSRHARDYERYDEACANFTYVFDEQIAPALAAMTDAGQALSLVRDATRPRAERQRQYGIAQDFLEKATKLLSDINRDALEGM